MRLAAAIGRFFSFEGEVTADELVSAMNDYITDNDALTVGVSKTDKGVLWTVTASK